jgi:hypothetical protein
MTKEKRNLLNKVNSKLSQSQVNRLITISIILVVVASVLGISSSVFLQKPPEGFSELSLLMYNSLTETYEADNYPEQLYSDTNESIYFMVKNFENTVKYYQLQIKVVELTQNVSSTEPIPASSSYFLYDNNSFEKILSPATNAEKKETGTFTGDYIWGPIEITLFVNSEVVSGIVSPNFIKIVFELWEYNLEIEDFQYTGVFTFLELDYWVF